VDVFAPCATHGVLNKESVKNLKCKMVVGGANNQLDCPATGALLFKRGILYAPDYIVNAGGVISVADEYHNPHFSKSKLEAKVKIVADTLKNIYDLSRRQHKPTNIVADELAKAMLNKKYAKQPLIARV
jgi:glutamate dehydrogenase/leucine dehydrogenase